MEPVVAEHDLDNLKLEQLGEASTLSAEYELEALMLTGRCIDQHSRRRDLVSHALCLIPAICLSTPLSQAHLFLQSHQLTASFCIRSMLSRRVLFFSLPSCNAIS